MNIQCAWCRRLRMRHTIADPNKQTLKTLIQHSLCVTFRWWTKLSLSAWSNWTMTSTRTPGVSAGATWSTLSHPNCLELPLARAYRCQRFWNKRLVTSGIAVTSLSHDVTSRSTAPSVAPRRVATSRLPAGSEVARLCAQTIRSDCLFEFVINEYN